jgi:hypothetical protein
MYPYASLAFGWLMVPTLVTLLPMALRAVVALGPMKVMEFWKNDGWSGVESPDGPIWRSIMRPPRLLA